MCALGALGNTLWNKETKDQYEVDVDCFNPCLWGSVALIREKASCPLRIPHFSLIPPIPVDFQKELGKGTPRSDECLGSLRVVPTREWRDVRIVSRTRERHVKGGYFFAGLLKANLY